MLGTKRKDDVEPYWQDEKDWLCIVEFLPTDNSEARLFAADIIGYLVGYANLTNTRSLALLGDPDASAYELLFSFSSPEEKNEYVAHDLLAWYEVTPYKKPSDYVWATDANRAGAKRGKQPVWLSAVMRDYIQPAARKLGITKRMSWHTFRHTFSTLLKGNGEDVKVVQELLRHSTAKMTLDTYTQALSPQKRAAQSKVVGMIRSKPSCTVVVPRVSGEIPVTH